MTLLVYALYIVAIVFFVLAGLGAPPPSRLNWLGWGLAFWCLAQLIAAHGPALPPR